MHESNARQTAEHDTNETPRHDASRPFAPVPDDVNRVLESFEANLQGLKKLYTERQLIQATLQEREVGLLLREKELSSRALDLDAVKNQIEELRRSIEQEREALASRDASVQARESELNRSASDLEKGLVDLRAKNEELKRWADEHDRQKAALAAESEQLSKAKTEVEQAKPRIANARKEIEHAARAMADVEQRRAEVAVEAKKVADARAEVESLQMRLENARDEIEEAKEFQASIEQRRSELEAQAARIAEERAKLDVDAAAVAELRSKKAQIEGELAVLDQKKGKAESLAEALSAMEQSLTDQSQELDRLKVELAEARAGMDQRETGLNTQRDDVARLERELAAMREVVEEYEQLWTIEREHAAELMTQLAQQASQAASSLATAPVAESIGHAASREEVEQLESLVRDLKDRLRTEILARRQAEELATNPDSSHSHIETEAKLEKALAQLSLAQAEIERLRSDSPSFSTEAREAILERRRERLRACKRLVREKQEKLRAGGEALRRRFEQCEEVMKQRSELAAVAERVKAADRRHQKNAARSRVANVVLCWMLVLGIMAGLSYAVSRQVVPGVFVAKTVLKADGRGRELTDGEKQEWQTYHEALLADPRFADIVAKRMARKGMAATNNPAEVADMVKNRLAWESAALGELRLELKGSGATNTERELDTISTALAGEANAARTNQAHAAVTTPPTPAATNGMPLDNSQLIAAGSMLGVGFVILVGIAMAMYKKLAQAKTRFERDAEMAHILDDAHWPKMDNLAA
jgi:chromosome segregation ATPase